ncbi:TPA: Dam family site-specific DNA-(adenine-N6)-methyltransferase [Klebsiella pneumoniae]|nr:Dam family site-specific DNA-(adenine-N6)-methyltransferase [Klebsiella pneumoniae]
MIKSPIKWAGGKTRAMPELLKHLPKADCLIEPFVGSGTVFMNTEYRSYVLCDSNPNLINFFIQLTGRPADTIAACREVFNGGNNAEEFYKRRAEFNSLTQKAHLDPDAALLHAAYFLYLNRHTYNGLYRENLKGEFNSPFGKYTAPYFPENEMRLFAEKANDTKAIFMHSDFRLSIRSVVYASDDAVIYCDPPYIPASKTANFTAYGKPFTLDDHRQFGTRAVISNSDTPETREIYSAFNLHAFSVRRSVSAKSRDMAGEVIGVLRVCSCCSRSGGGYCPVMGNSTYGAMVAAGVFDGAEGL